MRGHFSRNDELLKRRNPVAARAVESASDSVEIFAAKSGAATGRFGATLLHSAHDPITEAKKLAAASGVSYGGHVALYGFGLGHHIKPLLEAVGPTGKVIAAEANASILKAALDVMGDSAVIADKRLTIISGATEAEFLIEWANAFKTLDPAKTRVVIHQPSFQSIPADFPKVKNAVEIIRMERRFPLLMGGKEKENFRRNLKKLGQSPGISALRGAYRGGVVYIIGAGPSLDRDIVHVTAAAAKAALFCSDTALPALTNAGITPDLVFTADPQEESMAHFAIADKFDLPLVAAPTANADVIEKWRGPVFFGFQNASRYPEPAATWAKGMGEFSSGGSISTFALETAYMAGAKAVVLAGQDFGYPWNRVYVEGSAPWIMGMDILHITGLITEKDYFGHDVKTSVNLYSYRRAFEALAAGNSACATLTLSSCGVRLDGVEAVGAALDKGNGAPFSIPDTPAGKMPEEVLRAFTQWIDET